MKSQNRIICGATRKAKEYWSYGTLKDAWRETGHDQYEDEIRHAEGVLGLNELRSIFHDCIPGDRTRCRHLVDGYWNEEDVRLRLAAELFQYSNCQVHGEFPIGGKTNTRKRRRMAS